MIAEIKFECAHCGQKIAVGSNAAGADVECPTCRNVLTIPLDAGFSEPRRTEPAAREKLAVLQAECERLRASATHSQAEIKSFHAERLALRNEAAALKQRVAAADAQLSQMEILHQRLEAMETQLSSMEQELAENHAALSRANRERAAAAQELEGIRSELAAAAANVERAQIEADVAGTRLAETESRLAESSAERNALQAEMESLRTQFTAATGELESLHVLMDRDETSRELLSIRKTLAAAEKELHARRQSAAQFESDLKKAESERDRLDVERIALHRRIAEELQQVEELSKDNLLADNAKLRELLDRQNEELKLRFRELTRFRRAKLTLKIAWALAAIGAIGLGYFFVQVLPTIEWAP